MMKKILENPVNQNVLNYLGFMERQDHNLIEFKDKKNYTHEGLEDFLKMNLPDDSKFILDGNGIIAHPTNGEIIAIEFGRYERAFKILNPSKYNFKYKHIKRGLLQHLKIKDAFKVSLGYFSNIYGDLDTVMDIRQLGNNWGLGIYFLDDIDQLIKEYYLELNKQ